MVDRQTSNCSLRISSKFRSLYSPKYMGVDPCHMITVTCIWSRDSDLVEERKGKLEVPRVMLEASKIRLVVLNSCMVPLERTASLTKAK